MNDDDKPISDKLQQNLWKILCRKCKMWTEKVLSRPYERFFLPFFCLFTYGIVFNVHRVVVVVAFSARFISYINLVRFLLSSCHCCCTIGVVYIYLFIYLNSSVLSFIPSLSLSFFLRHFCFICNVYSLSQWHDAWNAFTVKCEQRKKTVGKFEGR